MNFSIFILKIYSVDSKEIEECDVNWSDISTNNEVGYLDLNEIFKKSLLNKDEFIYFSLYSSYGGFQTYVTLQKDDSFSFEHSF